jgi:hypothetical protein
VKFVKLLTVLAVILITILIAVPAFAHTLGGGTLSQTCDTTTGKICLTLAGSVEVGNDARTVEFGLFGVTNGTESATALDTMSFNVPANKTGKPLSYTSPRQCFKAITTGGFTSFVVKVTGVIDTLQPTQTSDLHLELTITSGNSKPATKDIQFNAGTQEAVTLISDIKPCLDAPPVVQQASAPSPTATATATATATTLAQTGGFDFRFPLIGVVLLVAGGALYVVSASRGRSAGTK